MLRGILQKAMNEDKRFGGIRLPQVRYGWDSIDLPVRMGYGGNSVIYVEHKKHDLSL